MTVFFFINTYERGELIKLVDVRSNEHIRAQPIQIEVNSFYCIKIKFLPFLDNVGHLNEPTKSFNVCAP